MKSGWTKRPPPEPEVEEKSAERTRLYSSPIIYIFLRSRSPGLHCSELEFGFVPAWCPRGARWVPRFVTQGSSRLRRAPSREVTPSLTRHRSSRARRLRQLLLPQKMAFSRESCLGLCSKFKAHHHRACINLRNASNQGMVLVMVEHDEPQDQSNWNYLDESNPQEIIGYDRLILTHSVEIVGRESSSGSTKE